MPTARQSIVVNVDVTTAYDQWAQFASYPRWMEGVAAVQQLGDGRLHWVANVRAEFATAENETREWDARVTEQVRDERISWESVDVQPPTAGEVTFEPRGGLACRIAFRVRWEPEGGLETPSEVLAAVNQVVAADLARFKDLVEARDKDAGSWRGEVAV
jgi:uncharacterized membrane protein